MKRKGGEKAEQVPKKQKAPPKEEPESEEDSSEEEKVVQTNGKKNGKAAPAPKAASKKQEEKKDTKPAKKAEQTKKETKPAKQEKKPAKEDSDDEDSEEDEEEEEVKPPVKAKAKPAPKVEEKKGKQADNKKKSKKSEDDEDDDDDEDEEEEEKPKGKTTKADTKNSKAATTPKAKASKKDDDEEDDDDDDDDEDDDEEEEAPAKGKAKGKTDDKPAETGGLVMKSAAQGGLKIKGAPPPPVNTENVESSTIFIKNLPWSVTDEQIKELFSDCGSIKEIRWINDKETGKFKGFGFVDFESVAAAKNALKKNGEDVGGRPIRIDVSVPKPGGGGKPPREKVPGSRTVFIGKCPDSIEDDDIRTLFKSAGAIESIRWVSDKQSGKFKGCGFVVFEATESTDKAVALNGSTVKGSSLRIDYADD